MCTCAKGFYAVVCKCNYLMLPLLSNLSKDWRVCPVSATTPTSPLPRGRPASRSTQLWPSCMSCLRRTALPYRAAACLTRHCICRRWSRARATSSTCGNSATDCGSPSIPACVFGEIICPCPTLSSLLALVRIKVGLRCCCL